MDDVERLFDAWLAARLETEAERSIGLCPPHQARWHEVEDERRTRKVVTTG